MCGINSLQVLKRAEVKPGRKRHLNVSTAYRVRMLVPSIMRWPLAGAMLPVCLALFGCGDSKTLVNHPVTLPRQLWTAIPTGRLTTRGTVAEVCMPLPLGYSLPFNVLAIKDAHGVLIRLKARFVTGAGDTVSIPTPGLIRSNDAQDVCFSDYGESNERTYRAIDLWSDDTVTFQTVKWWTGTRRGFL